MAGVKGIRHYRWTGDNASYDAIHKWVRAYKVKPNLCERCKIEPPKDLANISGEYRRDINDFEYLCRKCHSQDPRRNKKISEAAKGNTRCLGMHHTEASKKKMSEAAKKRLRGGTE